MFNNLLEFMGLCFLCVPKTLMLFVECNICKKKVTFKHNAKSSHLYTMKNASIKLVICGKYFQEKV